MLSNFTSADGFAEAACRVSKSAPPALAGEVSAAAAKVPVPTKAAAAIVVAARVFVATVVRVISHPFARRADVRGSTVLPVETLTAELGGLGR